MSEIEELQRKVEQQVSEDDIICEIMKEYPELYDMLEYNEYTIKEKLEKSAYWYQNFRLLWIKEKKKLNRIGILKDEYIGNLYHQLRFENDIKLGKVEVEKYYIPKDEQAIKFMKLYMNQEIRVETFKAIAEAFDKQGYAMANFIKNMEL
jgi:hypothetical protein